MHHRIGESFTEVNIAFDREGRKEVKATASGVQYRPLEASSGA